MGVATVPARPRYAADLDDPTELTRLRVVMFTDVGRDPRRLDDDWRRRNVAHFFRRRLAEKDRGYDRATLAALLAWLRSTGITTVDLPATPDGEPSTAPWASPPHRHRTSPPASPPRP